MQIATAKTAGILATSIEALQGIIAKLDLAAAEAWPVTRVIATSHDGTAFEIIPPGASVTAENSALIMSTARVRYQEQLDILAAQLAGL